MKDTFLTRLGIHFRSGEPGWYYLSLGKWQPFGFLQHGGWVCMNWYWIKRFAFDVPKQRGWRWD